MKMWLLFAIGAFLCWGSYGPTIHKGQKSLGSLQVFICVGLAYCIVAVVLPVIVMYMRGMTFSFDKTGVSWGIFAGVLGAMGAFFVILAFMSKGDPLYVMPIVFAGAPIVNVAISVMTNPPKDQINPLLYVGFLLAASGVWMILHYKPSH